MNLLEQGIGQGNEGTDTSQEGLDENRAAEAAAMTGPTATGPMLDEKLRELFAHTDYEDIDHMGG